ncbi:MAG: hypothetical protein ACM30D_14015, partial [Hyphomicrobiales bacterium]
EFGDGIAFVLEPLNSGVDQPGDGEGAAFEQAFEPFERPIKDARSFAIEQKVSEPHSMRHAEVATNVDSGLLVKRKRCFAPTLQRAS